MTQVQIEIPFIPKCGYYWSDVEENTDIDMLIKKTTIDFNLSKNELLKFKDNTFVPGVGLVTEKLPEWYNDSDEFISLDLSELSSISYCFINAWHSGWGMEAIRDWSSSMKQIKW